MTEQRQERSSRNDRRWAWWKFAATAAGACVLVGLGTLLAVSTGGTHKGDSSSCHARGGICPTTTTTVPTTTTVTTTPTTGSVLFRGDWETGSASQWTATQCVGDNISNGIARGTYTIGTATVAQGVYSAIFDLPAATVNNACEAYRTRTVATGTDDFYAFELMFPAGWVEPSSANWGMLVGQFNYMGYLTGVGPPVGIAAHAGKLVMTLLSGNVVNGVPTYGTGQDNNGVNARCGTATCQIVPQGQLTLGVWHQVIVHVHWATDSTGKVDSWWKRRGEATWNPEAYIVGVPTLQWLNNTPYPASQTSYDKIGAYRGVASFPTSVRQDGFCVASSFAAAEGCL